MFLKEQGKKRCYFIVCKIVLFKVLVQAIEEQERLRMDEDYNLNASEDSEDESESD